ncbi:restriction endonuclease [Phaeospirillum tilakii]|uniref:Restriction endonuclease n=1 Tax=Phaeospirillum tilakii TaxID=741673 RepID=A0ABW5CBW7_9PROT
MIDLDETVGIEITSTASWRQLKAVEFPNDNRNIRAAEILERLASQIHLVEGSHIHHRIDAILENEDGVFKFSESLLESLRLVGFSIFPKSLTDFLSDIISEIDKQYEMQHTSNFSGIDLYSELFADAIKIGPKAVELVEGCGRHRAELLLIAAINRQKNSSFITGANGAKRIPRNLFQLIENDIRKTHDINLLDVGAILQTVVKPEKDVDAGRIVAAVSLPWFEIIELLQRNQNAAWEIPPDKWEEIIAGAYKNSGYDEVILTPRSGDYGRDVIAVKKGIGQIRVIDQVKAYKPPNLVKADHVRALIGVLESDGASKAFLTTTSDFAPKLRTDPLLKPWMPSRLELIGRHDLIRRLAEIARTTRENTISR